MLTMKDIYRMAYRNATELWAREFDLVEQSKKRHGTPNPWTVEREQKAWGVLQEIGELLKVEEDKEA